jgi:integrase/recombinase XerC
MDATAPPLGRGGECANQDGSCDERDLRAAIVRGFEGHGLSEQSCRRMLQLALRFVTFVERRCECASLFDVDAAIVNDFVAAPLANSAVEPTTATLHLRRSAVRLLFSVLRHAGFTDRDPTLDLVLPPRSSLASRPLTDDEVAMCRSFALDTLTATRLPAAWALAEASARTSELPRVRVADLDLDREQVWLAGGTKVEPRWGALSEWGTKQLARRLDALNDRSANTLLVYRGTASAEAGQAAGCVALTDILRRAGLAAEPDVRPVSVAAWAGRRAFDASGRIEHAASVLGVRSLDRAAALIGWDWSTASERT